MQPFTLAIMAGGASSRMGQDKSFVEIDGQPLIERIIQSTHDMGQAQTLLITNRPDDYSHLKLTMVGDIIADKGALGGIYTAIHHSQTEHVLVLACDMPLVSPPLLRYMVSLLDDLTPVPDVIVPRVQGYPQGLHAVYSRACLPHIEQQIAADRLKVISFYDSVRVHYLDESDYQPFDPDGNAFFNVNTPEQLDRARDIIQKLKEQ